MDRIDNSISLLEYIKKVYEDNCIEQLEEKLSDIKKEILELLEKNKLAYNLQYKNSVHEIDLFKIDGRVKKPESILEKFIRKDEGLKLLDKLDIKTIEDVTLKKEEIIKYFNLYEDIIGIKIITELSEDCKNVYKLLLEEKDQIKGKIVFKDIEPDIQPKKMKNGLDIYNIKCNYENSYGFELQIKSKINSAWGDLDHSIFYKNYNYSPIKDTVQLTMNHIGNMLNEIERHLYTIRNANDNYEENSRKIRFIEQLHHKCYDSITDKFSVSYKIDKLCEILLFIYDKQIDIYNGESIDVSENDYYNLMEIDFSDDLLKNYKTFRDKSFEVTILENIIAKIIETDNTLNSLNYENFIKKQIDLIVNYIIKGFDVENESELNERSINIRDILKDVFLYVSNIDLFINIKNYKSINEWTNQVLDDYEVEPDKKNEIIKWWIIVINDGSIKEYLKTQNIEYVYDLEELVEKNIYEIENETSDKVILNELKKCNDIVKKFIKEIIDGR